MGRRSPQRPRSWRISDRFARDCDVSKDKPKPAVPKDKTDIPPKAIALDAGQLKPVIHALGPDRSVPTSIVIELATPVMDQETIGGECPAGDRYLRLTPARHGTDGFFVAQFEKKKPPIAEDAEDAQRTRSRRGG